MVFLQDSFLSLFSSSLFSFFSFPLPLLLLPFLPGLLPTVQAQGLAVQPSNYSADLLWTEQTRFHLESTEVDLPHTVYLSPLTRSLVNLTSSQLTTFDRSGSLVNVDATNSLSLQSSDIALISCDDSAYPGNLGAAATISNVVLFSQQRPAAVLLYSTSASHCNYTDESASDYSYLFTLLSANSANTLQTRLDSPNKTGISHILSNMSAPYPSANSGTSGDGGGSANSPNTAMIILYSITGIITALFLSIIITGAVRAHRHPERYGPRQRPGRPRQSRARGIARAMLETIPIVKFGDEQDSRLDADKGDVEMSMASEVPASQTPEDEHPRQPPMATGGTISPTPDQTQRTSATSTPQATQERRTGAAETESAAEHPNFSCPICTDDFIRGQDLRVLPCNHQFHPECIDPWLVNVSGTCPLCRIDLNPPQAEGENENREGENAAETAAQEEANERPAEGTIHRHRRISTYLHHTLNARRMRDASVEERLAALRSVREETSRGQDGSAEETAEQQQQRRRRLSTRLREHFRIRTRAHGDEAPREEASI